MSNELRSTPEVAAVKTLVTHQQNLKGVIQLLAHAGAVNTGFGYDLSRGRQAKDLIFGNSRFLIYHSSQRDQDTSLQMAKTGVPQFPQIAVNRESKVTAIAVPIGTRPLDSFEIREQAGTTSRYVGAIEIMQQLGSFLALLQKQLDALPLSLSLRNLAFLSGEEDFIRLIPPVYLSPKVSLDMITERLLRDLKTQLPQADHSAQLASFVAEFNKRARHGTR